jgi:hypothetical protein
MPGRGFEPPTTHSIDSAPAIKLAGQPHHQELDDVHKISKKYKHNSKIQNFEMR